LLGYQAILNGMTQNLQAFSHRSVHLHCQTELKLTHSGALTQAGNANRVHKPTTIDGSIAPKKDLKKLQKRQFSRQAAKPPRNKPTTNNQKPITNNYSLTTNPH
jgi:hypothetical protein